jgi:hemolysin activation/secretion protein
MLLSQFVNHTENKAPMSMPRSHFLRSVLNFSSLVPVGLCSLNLEYLLAGITASLLLSYAPLTVAQTRTNAPEVASFAIRGFSIKGDNPLSSGETSKVLAPFLRADANIDVLQKATAALENALRTAGFALHRVALPPQEVGDTVSLEIVKFTLGKITLQGNQRYDAANLRASVPELKEGGTPDFGRLAVQTTIANENPSKQITVALKESESPDAIDAAVQVKESKPWNMALSLSNTGTRASGRDRTTISGGYHNLWNADHQLMAAYTTSLERPQDVKQLGLSYRAPLYGVGGVVGASYTRSDVVGNFGTFTSTGRGRTLALNYNHYLAPEGGKRSFVTLGVEDKLFKAAEINDFVIGTDRRSRPLTAGYSARYESNASVAGYNAEFVANTGSGAHNNLTSYQAEDARITTRAFKILRGAGNYASTLGASWLWGVRSQLQWSPKALISGEQFGLGGVTSVRGASDRVLLGDTGLSSSLEVTSPQLIEGLRLSGFIDAGWLKSAATEGTTKVSRDGLASTGLGLRYSSQNGALISADYGVIISGSRLPLVNNSSAPQKGSDKLHVNLSVRF